MSSINNNQPIISIICPIYNIEKYLKETLSSVQKQTFKKFELILINDSSTDKSLNIAQNIAQYDSRILIINNKNNTGPGKARNIGISQAKGKYLTFLDHDDLVSKNWLELLYNSIITYNSDISFCRSNEYFSETQTFIPIQHKTFDEEAFILTEKHKKKLSKTFFPPYLKLVKKSIIDKHNIKFSENHNRFDDVLFQICLIHHTNRVSFVNKYLYSHRNFSQSISEKATKDQDMYFDHIKTIEDIINYCQSRQINPQIILNRVMRFFVSYNQIVKNFRLYNKKMNYYLIKYKVERNFSEKMHIILHWILTFEWKKGRKIIRLFGIYLLRIT